MTKTQNPTTCQHSHTVREGGRIACPDCNSYIDPKTGTPATPSPEDWG